MVKSEGKYVKNTTFLLFSRLLNLISPLLCRGCGGKGDVVCECCKNYIISQVKFVSLLSEGEFPEAKRIFSKARFLGYRDEFLGELVEEYKYNSVREIGVVLAKIVAEVILRELGDNERINIVPMPTSFVHIRERGFDHIDFLVQNIVKNSKGKVRKVRLLERRRNTVQVGSDVKVRTEQAKKAIGVSLKYLDERGAIKDKYINERFIIVDDVWTTGASLTEAGKLLRGIGVKDVEAVAITKNRQGRSPIIRGRNELYFS